jgi:hypothetical protein
MKHVSPADLDELDQMVKSPGYAMLKEHLEMIVSALLQSLKKPMDQQDTAALRGEIAGVERCLRLPAELKRSMEAAIPKGKS